ncbi:MAG: hypothetical protein K6F04_01865 [bacterium]|nr:hypothetical protein [bacterium]
MKCAGGVYLDETQLKVSFDKIVSNSALSAALDEIVDAAISSNQNACKKSHKKSNLVSSVALSFLGNSFTH